MTRKDTTGFVTMTKAFESDMADCTLAEIGLMSLLITSKAATPVGTVYRRHEWAEFPGANEELVAKLLDGLESKGKVVRDRHEVLIRSWMRHRCFASPNFLKACLYPLQVQVRSPLFRTVIATELLRKDVASIAPAQASRGVKGSAQRLYPKGRDHHYQALELIWEELTGKQLPPAETITGSLEEPNQVMVQHILETREFSEALPELDARNWECIEPTLADALRSAFHGSNVAPLRGSRAAN